MFQKEWYLRYCWASSNLSRFQLRQPLAKYVIDRALRDRMILCHALNTSWQFFSTAFGYRPPPSASVPVPIYEEYFYLGCFCRHKTWFEFPSGYFCHHVTFLTSFFSWSVFKWKFSKWWYRTCGMEYYWRRGYGMKSLQIMEKLDWAHENN